MFVCKNLKTGMYECKWNYTNHKELGNGSLTPDINLALVYSTKQSVYSSTIWRAKLAGDSWTDDWEFIELQICESGPFKPSLKSKKK